MATNKNIHHLENLSQSGILSLTAQLMAGYADSENQPETKEKVGNWKRAAEIYRLYTAEAAARAIKEELGEGYLLEEERSVDCLIANGYIANDIDISTLVPESSL